MHIPLPQIQTTDQELEQGLEYIYAECPRDGKIQHAKVVVNSIEASDPTCKIKMRVMATEPEFLPLDFVFTVTPQIGAQEKGIWKLYDSDKWKFN